MIKKTLTFENFDGDEITREFYFHLSASDYTKLDVEYLDRGGLEKATQVAIDAGDGKFIMELFSELIARSVGRRSPDGESFLKTDEIRLSFLGSPAYDALFFSLLSDPKAGEEFMIGVLPATAAKRAREGRRAVPQDHKPKAPKIVTELPPLEERPVENDALTDEAITALLASAADSSFTTNQATGLYYLLVDGRAYQITARQAALFNPTPK